MISMAMRDFNIDLSKSWLVGDKESDVQTAINGGFKSILLTASGINNNTKLTSTSFVCKNIDQAENTIVNHNEAVNWLGN